LGDPFFLQVPSVDKWSNMSVLYQPTGFNIGDNVPLMFIVRIYTTLYGVGSIQMDGVNISALLYQRIEQSDYYYYETETTNSTHRLSALDANVNYSVFDFC
jgi:hypothetical protein